MTEKTDGGCVKKKEELNVFRNISSFFIKRLAGSLQPHLQGFETKSDFIESLFYTFLVIISQSASFNLKLNNPSF